MSWSHYSVHSQCISDHSALYDGIIVAEGKHALKLLDSSAVDIYKDTHAVIFMLNPHSEKSLQYVR